MSCGADTEANDLLVTLLQGKTFEIPSKNLDDLVLPPMPGLSEPVPRLTVAELTTKTVDGTGVFDVLMSSMKVHLKEEYSSNRITGAEYTKAYIALVTSCLGSATQFLLQRDQTYWQAQLLQIQAVTAAVQLEVAKVEYVKAQLEGQNQEAIFGLTKIKISNESATYCLLKDDLENLRPIQKQKNQAELVAQNYTNEFILSEQYLNLAKQGEILQNQAQKEIVERSVAQYNLDFILPTQQKMLSEQMEAARAQTSDTRTDLSAVAGSMGKQKELYTQQIDSYQRDSETKVAKLFTDSWIAQKTIDEGLLPPTEFNNTSLDTILARLKINNGLNV